MAGSGHCLLLVNRQCRLIPWYAIESRNYSNESVTLSSAGHQATLCSQVIELLHGVVFQGIYDTLKECAAISKSAGGIGLSIHNIRAKGSYIRGTNGNSNGIVPMLRVFNDTARYVDQVGGKLTDSINHIRAKYTKISFAHNNGSIV